MIMMEEAEGISMSESRPLKWIACVLSNHNSFRFVLILGPRIKREVFSITYTYPKNDEKSNLAIIVPLWPRAPRYLGIIFAPTKMYG